MSQIRKVSGREKKEKERAPKEGREGNHTGLFEGKQEEEERG